VFERDRVAVDPATLCSGVDHRVLTTHVIRSERNIDATRGFGDHVEVRERRLDHHHVGTLGDVEVDLELRFTNVAVVLLVPASVSAVCDRHVDGVAERPVERAGELGGVGHDRHVVVTVLVERRPNRCDLPVHHPTGSHDLGTRSSLGERRPTVQIDRGVIVDVAGVVDDATVPVIGVLVDAQVGDHHDVVADVAAKVGQGQLHDPIGVVRTAADRILRRRNPEHDDALHTEFGERGDLGAQRSSTVLYDTGQRRDRHRFVDALANEQRSDQVVDAHMGRCDEIAHGCSPTEAAGAEHDCEPNRDTAVASWRHRGTSDGAGTGPSRAGSVLLVSVQAWFSNDEVAVTPGDRMTLSLTVHNLGDATESYTVVPAGLAAGWTTATRGNLTLFGGSQEVVEVEVAPPALPTTSAGPTAIVIRVIPLGDSDDAVVAETTIAIDAFDDCRIVALQPVQRARHRATYEFMVENHGNSLASCRLHLIDPTNRIDGTFDPPAVGVAPGGASLVRLKSRAQRGVFRRSTRTLDFEIEAERQGHSPVSSAVALVQPPTIPGAAIARVLTVVAVLGGLALAWFALLKPTIEDAAADEVDRAVAELAAETGADTDDTDATAGTGTDTGPETTVATSTPPPGQEEGEPTFFRLSVAAPLTQTADASSTLPDGELFDMTDVRIENNFNDRGVATLLVNGEQIFIWSLENVRGYLFEPRLTPIRLQPGDNLTFSVRCDEIGDTTRATCTSAINIGGTRIEIDEV